MIDLLHLGQYQENNRIEAKKALGGLPESLWETYSAFANTLGGVILLGVKEAADRSLYPVDLPDPEWLLTDFWEAMETPGRVSVDLLTEEDVQVHKIGGSHVITISVPHAPRAVRPVYVNGCPQRGTYRRCGEGDFRCSVRDVELMLYAREHYDPAEDSPEYRRISELADEAAQQAIEGIRLHMTREEAALESVMQMDWCIRFWEEKQRILRERFGIAWRTPAELFSGEAS